MLLSVLLLFWMLAACRGHWRGRYVDLKTSANLKSVILVLEGPQCPGLTSVLGGTPAIHKMSVQISSVFQNPGAAQLTLRDLKSNCEKTNKKTTHNLNYLLNKFRFFFSFFFLNCWRRRVKEYEMLTRASLRSDPTVTLLLCHSSPAWHGAARIWVWRKRKKWGKWLCLACVKIILGSSQKRKQKNHGTHFRSSTYKMTNKTEIQQGFNNNTIILIYCNCTHRKMVLKTSWSLLKTVWFSFFTMWSFIFPVFICCPNLYF